MAPQAPDRVKRTSPPERGPSRPAALLALALIWGCSAGGLRPGIRGDTTPRIQDRSYLDTLEAYTRYESCYEGFDARALVAVTFESREMRRARVIATARMQGQTRMQEEELLAQEEEEASRSLDFLVSLYTPILQWNEIGTPKSIWLVEIPRDDAPPVAPSEIERIARPNANMRALYPFISPFGATYRLRFPRLDAEGRAVPGPDTPRLVLQIGSALCRLAPDWPAPEPQH